MFVFDLPYGSLRGVKWDGRFSYNQICELLVAFRAVQAKEAWFALFWAHWSSLETLFHALADNGYTDVCQIVWYKQNHLAVGRPDMHVNAVENCISARYTGGKRENLHTFMNPNPTKRHNVILADRCRDFLLNDRSEKVNVCQKPLDMYRQLLPLYVKKGDTMMVGGFGAGGEIAAGIDMGLNVVAFEKDKVQFKEVAKWLRNYDAWQVDLELKQQKRLLAKQKREANDEENPETPRIKENACLVCGTPDEDCNSPCCRCGYSCCPGKAECSSESSEGTVCTVCVPRPKQAVLETPPVGEDDQDDASGKDSAAVSSPTL